MVPGCIPVGSLWYGLRNRKEGILCYSFFGLLPSILRGCGSGVHLMVTPDLFTPFQMGAVPLPNRIVMAALTRCRSHSLERPLLHPTG
ncbi:MAG: hypothetical protein Q6L68_16210 [Thermostichus sp. DG02_5_bins_236]